MKYLYSSLISFLVFLVLPGALFAQSWSELGTGANALNADGIVYTITTDHSGNVYAAGDFTDGITLGTGHYYVAKWDGSNWAELGSGADALNANGQILSIASDAMGNIYAGGNFTDSNGHAYIAKWNGSTWAKLGNGANALIINSIINCIATDASGNVYAGGGFADSNGNIYVAKWDGSNWTALGAGLNTPINYYSVLSSITTDVSGNVYAAGTFTNLSGYTYVAKWNGSSWTEFGTGLNANNSIFSITVDANGNVYATGDFTNSNSYRYVAKWDGNTWDELGSGANALNANSWISSMTTSPDGTTYVAGNFKNLNGNGYVAKWNGNKWTELGSGANALYVSSTIYAIAEDALGNIYAGGQLIDSTDPYYYVAEYTHNSTTPCNSTAMGNGLDTTNIGRFIIGTDTFGTVYSHLANPTPMNSYVFNSTDTIQLFVDSTYHLQEASIMNTIHDADAKVTLFIDYNANGQYDIPQERVWTSYSRAFYYYILDTDISIPSYAVTDTPIGMRLIINNDTSANAASDSACGTYVSGETEDFVVVLRNGSLAVNSEHGTVNSLTLWPNPSSGAFNVHSAQPGQLTLFDMLGTAMAQYKIQTGETSLQLPGGLAPGIYIAKFLSATGATQVTRLLKK